MKDEKKTPEILQQPQDGETSVPDSELDKVSGGAGRLEQFPTQPTPSVL